MCLSLPKNFNILTAFGFWRLTDTQAIFVSQMHSLLICDLWTIRKIGNIAYIILKLSFKLTVYNAPVLVFPFAAVTLKVCLMLYLVVSSSMRTYGRGPPGGECLWSFSSVHGPPSWAQNQQRMKAQLALAVSLRRRPLPRPSETGKTPWIWIRYQHQFHSRHWAFTQATPGTRSLKPDMAHKQQHYTTILFCIPASSSCLSISSSCSRVLRGRSMSRASTSSSSEPVWPCSRAWRSLSTAHCLCCSSLISTSRLMIFRWAAVSREEEVERSWVTGWGKCKDYI